MKVGNWIELFCGAWGWFEELRVLGLGFESKAVSTVETTIPIVKRGFLKALIKIYHPALGARVSNAWIFVYHGSV